MPMTRARRRTIRFGPVLGACLRCSRRAFSICRISARNELLAFHVAAQFGERIGRDRLALRCAHVFDAPRRLLQLGIEVANTEPRQCSLDAVDDSALLANEGLAFAMGALGIFLRRGRDGDHLAVLTLAAQPTKKRAFQALSVEPVGLGASVLARYRNACGMNDVDLDCARSQPTREPEAVPARFEGDGNAVDLVSCLLRLRSPSLEQLQEFVLIGRELLQWLALHAGYDPRDEPALLAQSITAINV